MRFSKLLVLSVLGLFGLNANAADLIERTAPSVTDVKAEPVEFEAEHQYLLYNTGAKLFFSQGNAWGTKASGHGDQKQALRMYFTKYVPTDGEWDGQTYIFKIYSSIRSTSYAWHECFFDSPTAMFVDRGSQANLYWEVQDMGNKVYRLKAAQANPDFKSDGTQFVGYDRSVPQDDANLSDVYDNAFAFPLSPMLTEGEGISLDWVFYDAAIFDAYDAAPALKDAIEMAEKGGIDVSAAVAVYNNVNATVAEINAAVEALKAAMTGGISEGTAEKPSIATSLINNANFDNASNAGWSGTAPNMTGSGSHGPANAAEHYNKTFDTYQDIENMPNGVYLLTVNSFFRGTWEDYTQGLNQDCYPYLYAQTGSEENTVSVPFRNAWAAMNLKSMAGVTSFGPTAGEGSQSYEGATYFIPNDPSAFRLYEEAGYYVTSLAFEVTDGKARIGVKKDKLEGGTDWAIFDSFQLMYFGNTEASYVKAFQASLKQMLAIPTLTTYTQSVLDDYNAAVNAATEAANATNAQAAEAAMATALAAVQEKADALYKNMRLWKQWEATIENAMNLKGEHEMLTEYLEFDYPEILAAHSMTNEEIEKDIAQITAWIEEASMVIAPGTDVTLMFLKNADCEKTDGWQGGPVTGSGGGNTCFEKYAVANFDVYQTVTKAPKGVYSIEVQGFYRRMRPESGSYTMYQNGEQNPCGYVYMNNNATALKCVYDDPNEAKYSQGNDAQTNADGVEKYYPNDMTSAAEAFAAGKYKSKAYGLVLSAGDELRIGVKGNEGGSDWAIWDNFKLVYEGYAADVVKPVLEEAIATGKENLKLTFGKDLKEQLTKAIADGEAALGGNDGEAMFNALAAIMDVKVDASVENFKNLQTRNEELAAAAAEASVCAPATIAEANALNQEITLGIEDGTYNDSDIEDLLAKISTMIKKLGMPEGMENATDENPMDCSSIIMNNGYDSGNNNGWTLDANPGFNMGLIEVYNANFDEYQVLEGLPEGTYEVSVQGFYRFGNGERDDSTYVKAPEENNNLLLYVTVGEETVTKAMPRLATDGKELHTSYLKTEDGKNFVAGDDIENAGDQWQWMWLGTPEANADSTAATGYRLANGMVPVSTLFEAGKFSGTSIIFKVGADGKARIGLKKEVQEEANWCIWDNWKLTYYGANSAKEPTSTGIANAAATVAAKTEFYGLNGARISQPAKGVAIMKQTLSDGSVKVSKVIIK